MKILFDEHKVANEAFKRIVFMGEMPKAPEGKTWIYHWIVDGQPTLKPNLELAFVLTDDKPKQEPKEYEAYQYIDKE